MTANEPRRRRRSRTGLVVALCVLAVLGAVVYVIYVTSYPGSGQDGIVINWRVQLHFFDARTGMNYTPPAGIGFDSALWQNHTLDSYGLPPFAPLSTRDSSGTIFIQSKAAMAYSFADFFNIWGEPFDRYCVPDLGRGGVYCTYSEPVVYDSNNSSRFGPGDPIITPGPPITPGSSLTNDFKIKFVNSTNSATESWAPGKTVVYDSNGDGLYEPGETVMSGPTPSGHASLKIDPKIRFIDTNNNGYWDLPQPPPVMSDGNQERCVNEILYLSNGKDWTIIIGSGIAIATIQGGCY